MNFLLLALKYLPYILTSVKAVQDIAIGVPGVDKKKIVLDSIKAISTIGKTVDEQHVQVISTLIDSTVKSLNDSGVFSTSKPKPVV